MAVVHRVAEGVCVHRHSSSQVLVKLLETQVPVAWQQSTRTEKPVFNLGTESLI
jgi:hypothetical protein